MGPCAGDPAPLMELRVGSSAQQTRDCQDKPQGKHLLLFDLRAPPVTTKKENINKGLKRLEKFHFLPAIGRA